MTADNIMKVCDRHFGIGSDGILLGSKLKNDISKLRIYNPDGSEAEKSGNGLRIFMSHLYRNNHQGKIMKVETLGGIVDGNVLDDNGDILKINMGIPVFDSEKIPLNRGENMINEPLIINSEEIKLTAISIGNPHAVYFTDELDTERFKFIGPLIENHECFRNRTNVQAVRVIDRNTIDILIWERGAGFTLASGSSSCAAAFVSNYLGFADNKIEVRMPGGQINIMIEKESSIQMKGEVTFIYEGVSNFKFQI